MNVLIIGAGAAGLAALRHFSQHDSFRPVAYEKTGSIGGTWVYSENVGADEFGLPLHSSMYQNMRTNIPLQLMVFPDFAITDDISDAFVDHVYILNYLKNYGKYYRLAPYIKFYHHVVNVVPLWVEQTSTRFPKWKVTTTNLQSKESLEEIFDVILVCTGNYSVPYKPEIESIDTFPGKIVHSHDYRYPETFHGEEVVCLGAGVSATDIARDVLESAEKVYLSHRLPLLPSPCPDRMLKVGWIKSIEGRQISFETGESCSADSIIFCTGYTYSFPYLSESCSVSVVNKRVRPLYMHSVHIEYPSMAFIGLPYRILHFMNFHYQVLHYIHILENKEKIATIEQMYEHEENEEKIREDRGFPPHHAHFMEELQWDYFKRLTSACGNPGLPPVLETLWRHVCGERKKNLYDYKKDVLRVISATEFVCSHTLPKEEINNIGETVAGSC